LVLRSVQDLGVARLYRDESCPVSLLRFSYAAEVDDIDSSI
jgi:hypothetical protein